MFNLDKAHMILDEMIIFSRRERERESQLEFSQGLHSMQPMCCSSAMGQWLSGKCIWLVFRRSLVPDCMVWDFFCGFTFSITKHAYWFSVIISQLHMATQIKSVQCHHRGDISLLLPFCSSRNGEHWHHVHKIVWCHMTSSLLLNSDDVNFTVGSFSQGVPRWCWSKCSKWNQL